MLISLKYIKEKYNMNIKGIVHVGAHYGEEIPEYLKLGVDKIVCFEPLEDNLAVLNVYKSDIVKIYPYAIGDEEKTMTMNLSSNNLESSSLLQPKKHLEQYPWIEFKDTKSVQVKTLKSFEKEIEGCNYMSIDIQGYEYQALVGAKDLLNNFDYIYAEVNSQETYENNYLVGDIDNYLFKFGFIRTETDWSGNIWGDALYIKADLL
jgi:FkbM family methyltransferase